MDQEQANKKLVEETAAAWQAGHGSIFDIVSKDVVWTVVGSGEPGKTYHGLKAFFDGAFGPLKDRFVGDTERKVLGIYADGDVVVLRWNGTTKLDDGQTYHNRYAFVLTMRDGLVVRTEEFCDLATYAAAKARAPMPPWDIGS